MAEKDVVYGICQFMIMMAHSPGSVLRYWIKGCRQGSRNRYSTFQKSGLHMYAYAHTLYCATLCNNMHMSTCSIVVVYLTYIPIYQWNFAELYTTLWLSIMKKVPNEL